jgi:hypothetical protein
MGSPKTNVSVYERQHGGGGFVRAIELHEVARRRRPATGKKNYHIGDVAGLAFKFFATTMTLAREFEDRAAEVISTSG